MNNARDRIFNIVSLIFVLLAVGMLLFVIIRLIAG